MPSCCFELCAGTSDPSGLLHGLKEPGQLSPNREQLQDSIFAQRSAFCRLARESTFLVSYRAFGSFILRDAFGFACRMEAQEPTIEDNEVAEEEVIGEEELVEEEVVEDELVDESDKKEEGAGEEAGEGAEEDETDAEIEAMKKRVKEMEEEAAKIEALQNTVEKSMKPAGGAAAANGPAADARSIYVGNVDYSTTPEELKEFFRSCGTVNRITISVDKYSGQPKG